VEDQIDEMTELGFTAVHLKENDPEYISVVLSDACRTNFKPSRQDDISPRLLSLVLQKDYPWKHDCP